jgi:hypothetical protein
MQRAFMWKRLEYLESLSERDDAGKFSGVTSGVLPYDWKFNITCSNLIV